MTAPTKTPRVDAWAADNINGPDFIRADDARTLETELAAARAEADELARRVGNYMRMQTQFTTVVTDAKPRSIAELIVMFRAEMEKERGNG